MRTIAGSLLACSIFLTWVPLAVSQRPLEVEIIERTPAISDDSEERWTTQPGERYADHRWSTPLKSRPRACQA